MCIRDSFVRACWLSRQLRSESMRWSRHSGEVGAARAKSVQLGLSRRWPNEVVPTRELAQALPASE
eukprot:8760852-Alexandrium_andersonii.AAC.1